MSKPEPPPIAYVRSRWALFTTALVLGLALDLGTKAVAFSKLTHQGDSHELTSFFAFTRATNPGAAFGMFAGQHTFFMLVTVAAFVAVPYFVHTARRWAPGVAIVLGLILAGVIGNFWDRIVYGEVRDFLDVHAPPGGLRDFCNKTFDTYIWPTFNVADMWITGGAIEILTSQFFMKDEEETEETEDEEETKEAPETKETPSEEAPETDDAPETKDAPETDDAPETKDAPEGPPVATRDAVKDGTDA